MIIIFRVIMLHKQKKISDEKTRFFINTAHDIRTPLTLIKAPLEEVVENHMVAEKALPPYEYGPKECEYIASADNQLDKL